MVCAWVGNSFSYPLQPNATLGDPGGHFICHLALNFKAVISRSGLFTKPDGACDSKIESFMHSEAINEPIWGEVYAYSYLLAFCF